MRWSVDNAENVHTAAPDMSGLDNRLQENWLPLMAIADLAGGDVHQTMLAALRVIEAAKTSEEDSLGVRLLSDIRDAFRTDREMLTKELIYALTQNVEKPWARIPPRQAADGPTPRAPAKPFGIRSEDVHPEDADHGKGYKRARFEEAWQRYLPPELPQSSPGNILNRRNPDSEACNRASPSAAVVFGDLRSVQQHRSARMENEDFSHSRSNLHARTDRNPKSGEQNQNRADYGENRAYHANRDGGQQPDRSDTPGVRRQYPRHGLGGRQRD